MQFRLFIFGIIFLWNIIPGFSAVDLKIDSLKNVLSSSKSDTDRVSLLNQISYEYAFSDSLLCDNYARQAKKLAEKINYPKGLAKALANLSVNCWTHGHYKEALVIQMEALKIRENNGLSCDVADSYLSLGSIYYMLGNNQKSYSYFKDALTIYESCNDKDGQSGALNNLGAVCTSKGDNNEAIVFYLKALKMEEEEVNDKKGIINVLNNLGNSYANLKDYKNALYYHFRSLNLGIKTNNKRGISQSYSNIASIYGNRKLPDSTIYFAQKGLETAESIGASDLMQNACNMLAKSYSELLDFKHAYTYEERYSKILQQTLNEESTKQIHEMEARYQNEKKVREIEMLNHQNKTNRNAILTVSIGLGLFILLVVLLLGRSRLKQRAARIMENQNKTIEEKNKELERLSIVASETENVILIMDADGRMEWVNPSFERLNAITLEELKKLKGETIYDISNNPDIRNIIHECVQTKKSFTYESFNKTRDGKKVWESSTLTPIFDASGKLHKLIIIDTDVTARKHAEEIIQQKNKDITDSINYAKRIQEAILPKFSDIQKELPESFVLFKPRDIVSGDFYWFAAKEDHILLAAADCTGHGVPGAFMSMIGSSLLHQIVNEKTINDPAEVLTALDHHIAKALQQKGMEGESRDGMDIAFVEWNKKQKRLRFSGANRPLYFIRKGILKEMNPCKFPLGGIHSSGKSFVTNEIIVEDGDVFYIFTDGYCDQFGGEKKKKFMTRRFRELLLSIQDQSMEEQGKTLKSAIEAWKGSLEQIDDILVIGVRI